MDRLSILHRGITKDSLGIEIGPFSSPLVPKAAGFNVLSLDVFETEELKRKAQEVFKIPPSEAKRIEPVDLVGSASEISRLAAERGIAGRVDYVLSSHNFEHLPDPVRFLQGCAEILRPGGHVIMAVPDRRYTFDYFRPHSVTGDLLAAYFEKRQRPTAAQVFDGDSLAALWQGDGEELIAFSAAHDPARVVACDRLRAAYETWQGSTRDDTYRDAHCWVFTPASFELVLSDLQFLGLVGLDLESIEGPLGCEFYVRLTKPASPRAEDAGYPARRGAILHRINSEAGINPVGAPGDLRSELTTVRARMEALDAELASMQRSRSWRLTAPLRSAVRALRRLR